MVLLKWIFVTIEVIILVSHVNLLILCSTSIHSFFTLSTGICDFSTGKCNCFENWGSSDGAGNVGDLGDCGYRNQFNTNGGKIPVSKAKMFQKTLQK